MKAASKLKTTKFIYAQLMRSFRASVILSNRKGPNHYQFLGIKTTASDKEIKMAYFKLAKKYHPDLNQDDETTRSKFE